MPSGAHGADRNLTRRVAAEIEALHVEFERWFAGSIDDFDRIRSSTAADFTLVTPGGDIIENAELLAGLLDSHGSRQIRIRIENVVVRWNSESGILATYEEWQDHAHYTAARQSTVLFSSDQAAPSGLLWRHVHETWKVPPPGDN
jgi:hypothetical protein